MSVRILEGDALTMLRTLESASVQCLCTSPPYFNLRDYQVAGQIGLEATPAEFIAALVAVFDEIRRVLRPDGVCFVNIGDSYSGSGKGPTGANGIGDQALRQGFVPGKTMTDPTARNRDGGGGVAGIPAKNLLLIPERFALAMQGFSAVPGAGLLQMADELASAREADDWQMVEAVESQLRVWAAWSRVFDGWWVRSRIAWCKTSAMPESTRDRPTSAWEHIYMFTKSARYFWDQTAVRQPSTSPEQEAHNRRYAKVYDYGLSKDSNGKPGDHNHPGIHSRPGPGGANLRNYWTIPDTIRHGESQENGQDVRRLQGDPAPRRILLPEGWDDGAALSALRGSEGDTGPEGERGPVQGVHADLSAESGGAAGDTAVRRLPEGSGSESAPESEASNSEARHRDVADRRGVDGDSGAVREPVCVLWSDGSVTDYRSRHPDQQGREPHEGQRSAVLPPLQQPEEGQAPLTPWWLLGPEPSREEHYAAFPSEIPRRCIKAATSEKGACPACGAPWVRVVERKAGYQPKERPRGTAAAETGMSTNGTGGSTLSISGWYGGWQVQGTKYETLGWQPSCHCDAGPPIPQTVLDPFAGSGTTGLVASQLGRSAILIELSPVYARMAEKRLAGDAPMFTADEVTVETPAEVQPDLFAALLPEHQAGPAPERGGVGT